MNRWAGIRAIAGLTVVVVALSGAACGASEEDSVCGDGIPEGGEQCDDGNQNNGDNCTNACIVPARETLDVLIRWAFNPDSAPGFDVDSCFDMKVSRVQVEIASDAGSYTQEESCGFKQSAFTDVPPGAYVVRLSPLNIAGELLTDGPIQASFTIQTDDVDVMVEVPYDAWIRDYVGTFFFQLSWAGADCADASPPVAEQVLLLERDGRPIMQLTQNGDPLDGSAPGPCRPLGPRPEAAIEVPWGPATFTVRGLDAEGAVQYEQTFETFVGAGPENVAYEYDVGPVMPNDAASR